MAPHSGTVKTIVKQIRIKSFKENEKSHIKKPKKIIQSSIWGTRLRTGRKQFLSHHFIIRLYRESHFGLVVTPALTDFTD